MDAGFADFPVWGLEIASDGPCTLRKQVQTAGLSAGTITITGTVSPITLRDEPATRGVTYTREGSESLPNPVYVDGATITVEASGGADIPAFTTTVRAPPQLSGYSRPTSLSRSGYTATWIPTPGFEILIAIAAFDARARQNLVMVCRVPDSGTFTVPRSTFALLPPSFDRAILMFGRVAEAVQVVGDVRVMVDVVSSAGLGPPLVIEPAMIAPPMSSTQLHRETSPRFFLALGFELPTGGWKAQVGQRLRHGLHLVEEVTSIGYSYTSSLPADTTEEHATFGAGVRWTPFKPKPQRLPLPLRLPFPGSAVDLRSFYLTAVIGADLRDRLTQTTPTEITDESTWSPMGSLAIGLLAIQGHDWHAGPELRGQLVRFDGKWQRIGQFMLAIHLNGW